MRRGFAAAAVLSLLIAVVGGASSSHAAAGGGGSATAQDLCIGHHPAPDIWYTASCTGHDEPELDPISSAPNSAQDLTWTFVLPRDGATTTVDEVGPTFWIGGVVSDPNSLDGQAFLELQFYPNAMLKGCSADGGFNVVSAPGDYVVCAPVWEVFPHGHSESAAFNAPLLDGTGQPLVMHAGDTITDHQYVTAAADGMHITVTDVTTRDSGTIVLDSKIDGPLMPAYRTQQPGNDLGWGLVDDAPNAFVWEIGHTSDVGKPAGRLCDPGETAPQTCYSYNTSTWLGFSPLVIKGVTFGSSATPATSWAVTNDLGGEAEVDQDCGTANYGAPFCSYPWYAYNSMLGGYTFGGHYPGTSNDFGEGSQFATTMQCGGVNGPDSTYCSTRLT